MTWPSLGWTSLLLILSSLGWGCVKARSYSGQKILMAIDYTSFSDKGFMLTPYEYAGSYSSVGPFSYRVVPKVEVERDLEGVVEVDEMSGRKTLRHYGFWVVKTEPFNYARILRALHKKARALGANAIVSFTWEIKDEELYHPDVKGITRPILVARGFAIKRLDVDSE